MEHVDLQRRREDRARSQRTSTGPWQTFSRNPYVFFGVGFVLGVFAPGVFNYMFFPDAFSYLSLTILVIIAALIGYAGRLLFHKGPATVSPGIGSEKQLLLAILDAGGAITPVEAALETSLTVDEAEEILTHFADRGHLVVEGRDGALFYTLPGRRTTPGTRTV